MAFLKRSHRANGFATALNTSKAANSALRHEALAMLAASSMHWAHLASSCSKPRCWHASLKDACCVGCCNCLLVHARSSKDVAPCTWCSKRRKKYLSPSEGCTKYMRPISSRPGVHVQSAHCFSFFFHVAMRGKSWWSVLRAKCNGADGLRCSRVVLLNANHVVRVVWGLRLSMTVASVPSWNRMVWRPFKCTASRTTLGCSLCGSKPYRRWLASETDTYRPSW